MADINDIFPSKYLKATDLRGREITVAMREVQIEKIGDDTRPVLYFVGKEKGLVLNKTNSMNIALVYGPETDAWSGHPVTLFSAWVDYQGKQVQGLRVRAAQAAYAPAPVPARVPVPAQAAPAAADPFDDSSIPF